MLLAAACTTGEAITPAHSLTSSPSPALSPPSYVNDESGFQFVYPSDWKIVKPPISKAEVGEARQEIPNLYAGEVDRATGRIDGVSIALKRLEFDVQNIATIVEDLDNLAAKLMESVDGAISGRGYSTLGGVRSRFYQMDYRGENETQLSSTLTIAIRGDTQFTLICQGLKTEFPQDSQGCELIVKSFQFR